MDITLKSGMNSIDVNSCTTSSIWVCMINNRFLVAKGHTAWKRKSDVVNAFKHSEYWKDVVEDLKNKHPEQCENVYKNYTWWKYGGDGAKLEQEAYNKLLENKIVKYIEISPVPDWV
jgi:hypothetical protein